MYRYNGYNRKRICNKKALHPKSFKETVQSNPTATIFEVVVTKVVEKLITFIINFAILVILLLFFSKYERFNGKYELLNYVIEFISKIK